ncbi:MAG: ABC transporter permease [Nitrospinota bacterium]|nr:MAG: ABC transporter permease [Nitrospinota bacterium]
MEQQVIERGEGETQEKRAFWPGLRRFVRQQPLGTIGGVIVLLLILTAIFAPWLAPYGPKKAEFEAYLPPSRDFPMGTDHLGRDILSRVIWGARLSLYVGLTSVSLGLTIGALWGIIAAYFGGLTDALSQRIVDTLMAFPPIILALGLMAALGQSVNNVIIALTILLIPTAARTLRSTTLSIKEMGYVESARAAGSSHWRIIFCHILPNSLAPYIVLFTVNIAYAIVVEAALSFLGLGAPPDEPSWGGMLTAAADTLERAPWIAFFPGTAISLVVFGLNLLGDAIRDVVDPRLRGQGAYREKK